MISILAMSKNIALNNKNDEMNNKNNKKIKIKIRKTTIIMKLTIKNNNIKHEMIWVLLVDSSFSVPNIF